MKKILILLGLITSLAAGQGLAATPARVLDCSLLEDADNAGKFASLGYEIASFTITLQDDAANLALALKGGAIRSISDGGQVEYTDTRIFMGWDHSEHWAELTKEDELFHGTIAIEEDFAFAVTCRERL